MLSFDTYQANVILVDNNLNLLGRKVIKTDHVVSYWRQPTTLNDGGCLVPLYMRNGDYYPGEPFFQGYMVKLRREDIEITWDVVNEQPSKANNSVYPNPSQGIINIAVENAFSEDARIQIYDTKGVKCLDGMIGKTGNLITLDIHNLDAGLYVYKVVSRNRELTSGKFIKN